MPNLIASLDLGQTTDPTAYAILRQSDKQPYNYLVQWLIRFDLRTPYPDIVRYVVEQHSRPEAHGIPLAIDATGVGRPVVDMFAEAQVDAHIVPITITGGNSWSRTDLGEYRVPKNDLVGVLLSLLPADRLRVVARLGIRKLVLGENLSALLISEMQDFRTKISKAAHEIYAAREGKHDDIVLAVAMACWLGENGFGGAWDTTPDPRAATEYSKAPPGVFTDFDARDPEDPRPKTGVVRMNKFRSGDVVQLKSGGPSRLSGSRASSRRPP